MPMPLGRVPMWGGRVYERRQSLQIGMEFYGLTESTPRKMGPGRTSTRQSVSRETEGVLGWTMESGEEQEARSAP